MRTFLVLIAIAGCSGAASAVRPGDPTYARTVGDRCDAADVAPQPLVVDWRPESRADLEVAMRRGIAVVSYDCHHLRVLPDCEVEGRYGFVGVTPKDEQIQLTDADEIKVNLPAGVVAASGSIDRGASLDVHLSIAGKQMASALDLDRSMLRGHCDGATHFVRAVTVGAFTLETHADAKLATQVDVASRGGSADGSSDKRVIEHDGDPSACTAVTTMGVATAPPGCATPLRLDLDALGAAPAPAAAVATAGLSSAQPPVERCPHGLVWSDGACHAAATARPPACGAGVDECRLTCEGGDAVSCTDLGMAYLVGRVVALDRAAAARWFTRACDGGEPYGCNDLGAMLITGTGGARDPGRAVSLLARACGAEPKLCSNLAVAFRDGLAGTKDRARATELFSRACLGGDATSCFDRSLAYQDGAGVARDDDHAVELAQTSCRGGFMRGCAVLGTRFLYGKGVALDAATAVAYFRTACDAREPLGCTMMGMAEIEGIGGVAKDVEGGRARMAQACENDPTANTCAIYGLTLRDLGDERAARGYLQRACGAGLTEYCGGQPER